jgi:ribonucleoside-diphosphate reductase alpha chain
MYYYFVEASVDEAERFGPCKLWKDTCYGKGQFIFERRHKNIDKLVPFELDATLDWEGLRQRVLTTGIANTTGLAMPPVESSSQPLNTTNGIEMPLEAISTKSSKDGSNVFVVPEYEKLKNKYEYIFDQPSPRPYLRTVAVIQKWTCQSISANTNYNPDLFPDKKIPMNVILGDMLYAKNCGVKTLYYSKIKKQDPNEVVEDLIEAVSQPLPSDDDSSVCESCVL